MRHGMLAAWPRRAAGLLLLTLAACHVTLVTSYDEQFVKNTVATETDIDTLLQTQRNPPKGTDTGYDTSVRAYNKIDVDLNGLLALAESHSNNADTIAQVNKLIELVQGLEKVHREEGQLGAAYINGKQQDLRVIFAAILRTENDKKAGMT